VAYRAFMRAKVAGLHCSQGDPAAAAEARSLAELALRHARRGAVTLVLVGGLPGTGKSTLARQLAGRLGFTVLSSDRIRKELVGVPSLEHRRAAYQAGLYTPAWTERTYAELLRRAAGLLGNGESVIADASWISSAQRSAAAAVSHSCAADMVCIRCTAPPALAARRMTTRTGDVSDADPGIAGRLAADWQPWPEAVTIDTCGAGEPLEQAMAAVRSYGYEDARQPAWPYMCPG
jgi:predicted kinase